MESSSLWRQARRARFAAVVLLAFLTWADRALALSSAEETELMAAYVYNFSKFVHWPAHVLADHDAPLVLCVYGRPTASSALEALAGKSAQGHSIQVERLGRGEALHACHIVYVGESESPYLAPLLRNLAKRPILTVSEIPGFAAAGGMIGFAREDNRLRFEINHNSAAAAGLTISSQLLKLARRVVRE